MCEEHMNTFRRIWIPKKNPHDMFMLPSPYFLTTDLEAFEQVRLAGLGNKMSQCQFLFANSCY